MSCSFDNTARITQTNETKRLAIQYTWDKPQRVSDAYYIYEYTLFRNLVIWYVGYDAKRHVYVETARKSSNRGCTQLSLYNMPAFTAVHNAQIAHSYK